MANPKSDTQDEASASSKDQELKDKIKDLEEKNMALDARNAKQSDTLARLANALDGINAGVQALQSILNTLREK